MITLKKVNDALKRKFGSDVELVKGRGYFYFIGQQAEHFKSSSVCTYNLNAFTVDGWIAEYQELLDEYNTYR